MDISKISESIAEFFSKNTLEITCVVAASAAYHIYQHVSSEANGQGKKTSEAQSRVPGNRFSSC